MNKQENILNKMNDILNNHYDKFWDMEDNINNILNNIYIDVSSYTDLENAKYRGKLESNLILLYRNMRSYLDRLFDLVRCLTELNEILDEMESSKDKYLIIKIMKNNIKNFEDEYHDMRENIHDNDINDKEFRTFLIDFWNEMSELYEVLCVIF